MGRETTLAWQIALEASGFSPGLLDGIPGPKTALATQAFQAVRGLPVTGQLCERTRVALGIAPNGSVGHHLVTAEDLLGVEYCPPDWHERSRRRRLTYGTLGECLAERYHTSRRCLNALNPALDLEALTVGGVLRVPAPRERATPKDVSSIEIDLGRKVILLLRADGALRGLLHCSVAREVDSMARGQTLVKNVVADPRYTFDPKKWPEVKGVTRRLVIPPGPRSPVGVRWIGLSLPGVGIHGSPEPENIGKTGSHGCFRLTNWDATYLAGAVSVGTPVSIVDSSEILTRCLSGVATATGSGSAEARTDSEFRRALDR